MKKKLLLQEGGGICPPLTCRPECNSALAKPTKEEDDKGQ